MVVGAGPSGLSAAIRLEAARRRTRPRGLRLRAGEGLRGRRAYPVRCGAGTARAERAVPRLASAQRAAEHAGAARIASCTSPRRSPGGCPRRRRCTITATTSSAWATCAAGWASRPRRWGGDLSRLRCRRSAVSRRRQREGRGNRRSRHRPRRQAHRTPPGRHGAARASRPSSPKAAAARSPKCLFERFRLREGVDPQTYGIGIKELWEVQPSKHQRRARRAHRGLAAGVGAPTAGRSSITWRTTRSRSGFVVGLDYSNPFLSPFEEFQRFKTHPAIRPTFEGGRRISYGARAIIGRRLPVDPQAHVSGRPAGRATPPGFLNVPKIKGSHTAMKSGMTAAEAVFEHLRTGGGSRGGGLSRAAATIAGCGMSCTACAISARPSASACTAGSATRRSTPTCCAAGRPWTLHNHADHTSAQGGGRVHADRLSEAGRQRQLRPPVLGVHIQHQPRGGPAAAPAAQGSLRFRST